MKRQALDDLERESALCSTAGAYSRELYYGANWAELQEEKWTLNYLRELTPQELSRVALGALDVPFPDRDKWEKRLSEQKEQYVRALQQYTQARGAYLLFQEAAKRSTEVASAGGVDRLQEHVMNLKRARDKGREEQSKLQGLIQEGKERAMASKLNNR